MIPLSTVSTAGNNQPENCRDWVESRLGFRETEADKDTAMIHTESLVALKRSENIMKIFAFFTNFDSISLIFGN